MLLQFGVPLAYFHQYPPSLGSFLNTSKYIIQRVYAIQRVKIHIVKIHGVKRLTFQHSFNVKSSYFVFCQGITISAYHRPSTTSHKNSNFNIFSQNTINTTAQSTDVFSTIAHLLFYNRCQFFSHFLMVIEQSTLFTAQCYLNNWFKVLSSRITLPQSLVSQLIGTNKQSIKCS